MESYENLRLEKKDKIPKRGFFEKLFKKESHISEENLDFLEERYAKMSEDSKDFGDSKEEDFGFEMRENFGFQEEFKNQESFQFQDSFARKESFISTEDSEQTAQTSEQAEEGAQEDLMSLDDLPLKIKEEAKPRTTESQSINPEEKEAVLEMELESREIPFRFVCLVLACMLVALLVFVPKIYIRNNIYYASRNLIQLQAQLDSLNEENKYIKKQLEDIKFKNLTHELDF